MALFNLGGQMGGTPRQAAAQNNGFDAPVDPNTGQIDPGNNSFGFGASSDYDPYAAFLGRRPGMANSEAGAADRRAGWADQRLAPPVDYSQSNQSRGQVMRGLGMVADQAYGRVPSWGETMARRTGMEAQGAQMGMGLSARGGPQMQALAARQASGQMQNIGIGTNLEAQRIRAQQMEAGRNQLFQSTSGLRGQDLGQAQFGSDLELRQRAANDARSLQERQMALGTLEGERGALMQQQQMLMGDVEGAQQRQMQERQQQQQAQDQYINMGIGAAQGTAQAGMSMYNPNQPYGGKPVPRYQSGQGGGYNSGNFV